MSVITGDEGVVKIGSNIVAEVTSFELNGTVTLHDKTAMGSTGGQHLPGKIQRWSGTLNYRYDDDDDGQSAITLGAEVTLELYPTGEGVGNKKITVSAVIENEPLSIALDALSEKSITFQVNGRPTKEAITAP